MHLVINASELGRNRGGNETYIAGLIKGLAAIDSQLALTALVSEWDQAPALPSTMKRYSLGQYRAVAFWGWQQAVALHALEPDWYLSNFFLPPFLPCKGAIAVHDVSFRAHPEYYPRLTAWYMHWFTWWSVHRAELVITISEFSRQELLRFYPISEHKIVVAPIGVAPEYRPDSGTSSQEDEAVAARYGIRRPYILALGNIHPRKNLQRLLDAYLEVRKQRPDAPAMVWVGKQHWGSDDLLRRAHASGVMITGYVPQEDLPALYRGAQMLVYPSLYEGFGLPPVEALACGTPVIASNTTSLPEAVGDAAILVNPLSVDEMATAILRLMSDEDLRRHLRPLGLAQARRFTWKSAAERLVSALW